MKRFAVVVFDTVCLLFADKIIAKGGGVCFIPDGESIDATGAVTRIAAEQLIWDIGRCVTVGIATLDEHLLEGHCHKLPNGIYWQGGDEA